MARKRSEFLGSLGKLFSIFKKVVDRVLELDGCDEHIAQLDTNAELVDVVARLLLGDKPPKEYRLVFRNRVDVETIPELVEKAVGHPVEVVHFEEIGRQNFVGQVEGAAKGVFFDLPQYDIMVGVKYRDRCSIKATPLA